MCGKPRKFTTLAKLSPAGLQPLVAAGADDEVVAGGDRPHRRLEQREPPRRRRSTSWLAISATRPAFGAAGPGQPPEVEPAGREAAEPGGRGSRGRRSPPRRCPSARKAGSSRSTPQRASPSSASQACWKVRPTVWFRHVRERAHLGDEGELGRAGPGRWRRGASARAATGAPSSPARPRPRRCPSGRRGCRSR